MKEKIGDSFQIAKNNNSEVDAQRPGESQVYFQGSQFNLSSSAHTLMH